MARLRARRNKYSSVRRSGGIRWVTFSRANTPASKPISHAVNARSMSPADERDCPFRSRLWRRGDFESWSRYRAATSGRKHIPAPKGVVAGSYDSERATRSSGTSRVARKFQ